MKAVNVINIAPMVMISYVGVIIEMTICMMVIKVNDTNSRRFLIIYTM